MMPKATPSVSQRDVDQGKENLRILEGILLRVKFAVHLSSETRTELCRVDLSLFLVPVSHSPSEVIFKEGDEGCQFYIILEGTVRVSIVHPKTQQDVIVAHLKVGDTFGELALTDPDCKRKATVVCVTNCHFLTLAREPYLLTIQNELDKETLKRLSFLRHILIFEGLTDKELIDIASNLGVKNFASGKIVARQDEEVDDILFVLHGFVKGVRGMQFEKSTKTGVLQHEQGIQSKTSIPRRRGALTVLSTEEPSGRFIPDPPNNEPATQLEQTKLANLLNKHRNRLVGKATNPAASPGVFEVTMAALRASKRQKDRQLQEEDLHNFKDSTAYRKEDRIFIQVFEGGKYEGVGECSLVKAARQSMTVFTTCPTIFYTINKFELLKKLSEKSLEHIEELIDSNIDEDTLRRNYRADKEWKAYKRKIMHRIVQEQELLKNRINF